MVERPFDGLSNGREILSHWLSNAHFVRQESTVQPREVSVEPSNVGAAKRFLVRCEKDSIGAKSRNQVEKRPIQNYILGEPTGKKGFKLQPSRVFGEETPGDRQE